MARKTVADLRPTRRKTLANLRDPNADLIGRRIETEHGELVVKGSPSWSSDYVLCVGRIRTVRRAELVRMF